MITRQATNDDLDWLVQASARFARDFNEPRLLPEDPNLCAELWRFAIADHVVLIAVDDHGKRAGLVLGWSGYHPFNPAVRTLTEALWYVERDHPKRAAIGLGLLDRFSEIGREHYDYTSFSVPREGGDSLRRRGFIEVERVFSRWSAKR